MLIPVPYGAAPPTSISAGAGHPSQFCFRRFCSFRTFSRVLRQRLLDSVRQWHTHVLVRFEHHIRDHYCLPSKAILWSSCRQLHRLPLLRTHADITQHFKANPGVLLFLQGVFNCCQRVGSQTKKSFTHFLNESVHLIRSNDFSDCRTVPLFYTGDFSNAVTACITLHYPC